MRCGLWRAWPMRLVGGRHRRCRRDLTSAGILGCQTADSGPIKLLAPLGEEPKKAIVQQACQWHRYAQILGFRQREADVLVTQRGGERRRLKLISRDQRAEDLISRCGEDRGCE